MQKIQSQRTPALCSISWRFSAKLSCSSQSPSVSTKMRSIIQVSCSIFLLSSAVFCLPLIETNRDVGSSVSGIHSRIYGGKEAANGEFPYVASVRKYIGNYPPYPMCDGAIITNRFILTTADCRNIRAPPEEYEVVVGTVKGLYDHNGTIYNVKKWIVHEDYYMNITSTNATIRNDIALIKTSSKIKFNKLVAPIALSIQFIEDGAEVVASGWGKRDVSD